jgi:outer membrane receptor protein involved in Fe transport
MASLAAINYTQGEATLREVGEQSIIGGSITGEPFSDWAGPVSLAADAEWRREAIGGTGDQISADTGWFSTNFFPYFGSQTVTEGALETVVPLLKDKPFVQELDFNGAARATDYSTSGYVTTWKLGLEYSPINDVRVRATYSSDIRAPNLFNLFGYSNGHGSTIDPFRNNVSSPSYGITVGNPKLTAEKAHQYEIGVVFQPSEVPGLNLSVDYYHIKIAEAIAAIPSPLTQCFGTRIGSTLTGTSPYCSLVVRNADGSLYSVTSYSINEASFLASGVDYSGDYRKGLSEIVSSWKGTADLHITATNTMHDITDTGIPGANRVLDATGSGNVPRWAVFATLTYQLDKWRFAWTERYTSAILANNTTIVCQTNCPNPIPTGFSTLNVVPREPTYFLANVTLNYRFFENDQQNAEGFINVNNVFNKIPPFNFGGGIKGYGVPANQTLYDSIGLYVTAGLRFRL